MSETEDRRRYLSSAERLIEGSDGWVIACRRCTSRGSELLTTCQPPGRVAQIPFHDLIVTTFQG